MMRIGGQCGGSCEVLCGSRCLREVSESLSPRARRAAISSHRWQRSFPRLNMRCRCSAHSGHIPLRTGWLPPMSSSRTRGFLPARRQHTWRSLPTGDAEEWSLFEVALRLECWGVHLPRMSARRAAPSGTVLCFQSKSNRQGSRAPPFRRVPPALSLLAAARRARPSGSLQSSPFARGWSGSAL